MKLLHEEATAQSLLFLRCYIFGIWLLKIVVEPLHLLSYMPEANFEPIGVMWLIPRAVVWILLEPLSLHGLKMVMILSLILAIVGGRRWPVTVVACALVLLHQGLVRSLTWSNHAEMALVHATLVLTVFEVADALHRRLGRPVDPSVNLHAIPIQTIMALMCLVYCFVGVHRLVYGGIEMFTSDAMTYWIARSAFHPNEYQFSFGRLFLEYPGARHLLNAGAAMVTAFEVLSPLCLVLRRFRWAWIVVMLSFHTLVTLTMNIWFWENSLLYLVFIDYHPWLSAWSSQQGHQLSSSMDSAERVTDSFKNSHK